MADQGNVKRSPLTRVAVWVVDINWYGSLLAIFIFLIMVIFISSSIGPRGGEGFVSIPVNIKFSDQIPFSVQNISGTAVLHVQVKASNWV